MGKNDGTVLIENAQIFYLNFSGREGQYNAEGQKNFNVFLDDPNIDVDAMISDGWNVKFTTPREEGDVERPFVQVTVRYDFRPPKVVMITSRGKTILDETTVALLDFADITNVDLIFGPSRWEVGGRTGLKAYLRSMYVTVEEDELEQKYSEIPDVRPPREIDEKGE